MTGKVLGWERTVNVEGWNSMALGNIEVTIGLLITRIGYLTGAFWGDRIRGTHKGKLFSKQKEIKDADIFLGSIGREP